MERAETSHSDHDRLNRMFGGDNDDDNLSVGAGSSSGALSLGAWILPNLAPPRIDPSAVCRAVRSTKTSNTD